MFETPYIAIVWVVTGFIWKGKKYELYTKVCFVWVVFDGIFAFDSVGGSGGYENSVLVSANHRAYRDIFIDSTDLPAEQGQEQDF